MRALCYHGKGDIRFDTVPDPTILAPDDLIIKVDACAICGSDLHLIDGVVPTMKSGDVMGHETMGTVVEVGKTVAKFAVGDQSHASPGASPAAKSPARGTFVSKQWAEPIGPKFGMEPHEKFVGTSGPVMHSRTLDALPHYRDSRTIRLSGVDKLPASISR
jgi:hypothetical protein